MDCQLGNRVEDAEDYVEGDPSHGQPPRPVLAGQHEGSGDDRGETNEYRFYRVGINVGSELARMISNPNDSHTDIEDAEESDG